MKWSLILFGIALFGISPAFSQTVTPTPVPTTTPVPGTTTTAQVTPQPGAEPQAKPYQKEEFPGWALDLRRGEIIAVGSFPVMYLFSSLGFDYVFYFSNGMDSTYAPWPAGPGTSQWSTTNHSYDFDKKNQSLLLTAAALSVSLAVIDWLLGKLQANQ